MQGFYAIGELAKQADVSVQTLRHYHKLGLLEPSETSEAGYRFYSEQDASRLSLIRTLRELGFDLKTIAALLKPKQNLRDIIQLQLDSLAEQVRALGRQQVVLEAVAQASEGDEATLMRMQRLKVLASLNRLERESFLARQLGAKADDLASSEIWQAAILDMPESLDKEQLEIWLELAELAADDSFRQTLAHQTQPFEGLPKELLMAWQRDFTGILARASQLIREVQNLESDPAQTLVKDWIEALARVLNKEPNTEFISWMKQFFSSTQDKRFERYWELLSNLKALPFDAARAKAMHFLIEGLSLKKKSLLSKGD